MGKIRVRTLGEETLEQKQKTEAKQKANEKKFVKGGKGGERIVSVGPSEEELSKIVIVSEANQSQTDQAKTAEPKPDKRPAKSDPLRREASKRKAKERSRSKSYQTVAQALDRNKKYTLLDGLSMLEKLKRSKFDETVELHINTTETGLSGNTTLPHGTGKIIKVAIANDDVLAKVVAGKIDFDILLASSQMMPKLARVAKILGPRGLMPNPKNATLVKDPEKAAENFKKGQINFRTEAKAPIMHLTVGKMSFGAKKLSENIEALIDAIKKEKIRNITLKSTMSPGIKLAI